MNSVAALIKTVFALTPAMACAWLTVRDNTIEAEIAIEDRRPRDSGK